MTDSVFTPQKTYNVREVLQSIRLDYINNYLTLGKYAEHNGLTLGDAEALIRLATQVSESPNPHE